MPQEMQRCITSWSSRAASQNGSDVVSGSAGRTIRGTKPRRVPPADSIVVTSTTSRGSPGMASPFLASSPSQQSRAQRERLGTAGDERHLGAFDLVDRGAAQLFDRFAYVCHPDDVCLGEMATVG